MFKIQRTTSDGANPMMTWVLESDVFPNSHSGLREAILQSKMQLIDWDDAWWNDGVPATVPKRDLVFHGSLGNAARIDQELH